MHLSLTTWSFSRLQLEEAAAVAKAIGMSAIDISTRYRPGLDKPELLHDPKASAERVRMLGLPVSNYFHHFGADVADRNLALPASLDANVRDLERVLTFADAADIPTVFFLPGMINPGQSRQQAMAASVESLKAMSQMASHFRARICIEPAVRSFAETPDIARELVDRTGVALALDYSHFICLGYTQQQVDPLIPYAAHVHLRQARPGHLQASFDKGTLNFPALFGALREAGYTGALAIEFIRQVFTNDWADDVMTETILMRDCFNAWMSETSA
jgi:sugar phosphate isomerase/epimerase